MTVARDGWNVAPGGLRLYAVMEHRLVQLVDLERGPDDLAALTPAQRHILRALLEVALADLLKTNKAKEVP